MSALAIEDLVIMPGPKKRVNVDLDLETHTWLAEMRRRDRLKTTERLRALLAIAREDPDLNRRVLEKAAELDALDGGVDDS